MAGHAAAPKQVSELATDKEQPEPAEVDETKGESGDAGEAKAEEADDVAADGEADVDIEKEGPAKRRMSEARLAIIAGLVVVVALAALAGWLGFRAYESYQADEQHNMFLQVGKQGALNLTTIDWQQADADVQRVLDSATGTFYDDFQRRSQPFVEIVKQAQSKSEGTIKEAAVELGSGDEAQVLVAVTVKTSIAGVPEPKPRAWRMRITVQKVSNEVKVSNVEFVP